MRRLRFGPNVPLLHVPITPDGPTNPKSDVSIRIVEIRAERAPASILFAPDAYDPETSYPLKAVHFVAVPSGQPHPTEPQVALDSIFAKYSIDMAGIVDGSTVEVSMPDLVGGIPYSILSILEDEIPGEA